MGRVSNSELFAESTPIINHFSHQHQLQLFKFQPQQTLNLPSCPACNLKSSEIMYACLSCNYSLHQTCSRLPDRINHQSHSHQLKLTFSAPYPNQVFSCDICKKKGSNQWLYRCDCCEFDAHLKCGTSVPAASQQQRVGPQNIPAPAPSAAEMIMNSYNNSYNASLAAIAAGTNRQQNQLMNQVFQQTSNDVTSYNRIMQGVMAGGGAAGVGGTSQVQGLMGGGGAGNPLQALMGGGGGGVNLQALMGSGGGGVDLQALMGSGGGGVDLQALMGGGTGLDLQSLMGGGGTGGVGASLLQGFLGGLGGF